MAIQEETVTGNCPFCDLPRERVRTANDRALWIDDAYPIVPHHGLVLPKRYVTVLPDITADEWQDLLALLLEAQHYLRREQGVDGFNIGINDGYEAGQTVPHLHIHLIPRWSGDVPDLRGIRWLFPAKAGYWSYGCN